METVTEVTYARPSGSVTTLYLVSCCLAIMRGGTGNTAIANRYQETWTGLFELLNAHVFALMCGSLAAE